MPTKNSAAKKSPDASKKKAEEIFEEDYSDLVPDPADPVPVTLFENFYKDRDEDIDGDGKTDMIFRYDIVVQTTMRTV